MGGPNPNEITNTRNMRAAVDQAVQRLSNATPESINGIVHDIDNQISQHQDEKVIDPLFGDSTHRNEYTKAFTGLLNERLMERGILPQVLMTYGENKDNFMAMASGRKTIKSDALELAVADFDQSHSYLEAQFARDMQAYKSKIDHGKDGISPERLEAYAKAGNDFFGAKDMLQEFGTPAGYNRLSGNKPGAYVDRSDIQNMLNQNAATLTPDQSTALHYMLDNFDKIAIKGADKTNPDKRLITHLSLEEYAKKHHVTWDVVNYDQARKKQEQQLLDDSLDPTKSETSNKPGSWQGNGKVKRKPGDGWSDDYPGQ